MTSIYSCLWKHTFSLTKTLLRSSKHTRVCNRYPFDYYKCRRLRAFRSKRRLPIRRSFEQNWTLPCTVCPRVHLTTLFVILTSNTVVNILFPFDCNTYPEKSRSLDICFIHEIFHLSYFSIDNAHLLYNAHPKLFRHSFWCIDNARDAN
jgi:hypothetical protein